MCTEVKSQKHVRHRKMDVVGRERTRWSIDQVSKRKKPKAEFVIKECLRKRRTSEFDFIPRDNESIGNKKKYYE